MDYIASLESLRERTEYENYIFKYVPGYRTDNVIAPLVEKELKRKKKSKKSDEESSFDLARARDSMIGKSKNITKSEINVRQQIIEGSINVRIYQKASEMKKKDRPVFIYFHGGGFFGGCLDNVEQVCRAMADKESMVVVSVGYSLAPEHIYPSGLLDGYRTVKWVYEHVVFLGVNKEKISVGGDSAGGNLALSTAILDQNLGTNYVRKIVLYYPVLDQDEVVKGENWGFTKNISSKNREIFQEAYDEFGELCTFVEQIYAPNYDMKQPLISPTNLSEPQMKALPPILISAGELDPLCLQSENFYQKMRTAQGKITFIKYGGLNHAFIDKIGVCPQSEDLIDETVAFLMTQK